MQVIMSMALSNYISKIIQIFYSPVNKKQISAKIEYLNIWVFYSSKLFFALNNVTGL